MEPSRLVDNNKRPFEHAYISDGISYPSIIHNGVIGLLWFCYLVYLATIIEPIRFLWNMWLKMLKLLQLLVKKYGNKFPKKWESGIGGRLIIFL